MCYAIQAIERNEKPKQARNNGFVPGVLYGKDMDSVNAPIGDEATDSAD
ncbi:MAG: hypothetical protein ACRKFN_08925 [Desulfitobacterium sp.]